MKLAATYCHLRLIVLSTLVGAATTNPLHAYGVLQKLVAVGDTTPKGEVITSILNETALSDQGTLGVFAIVEQAGGQSFGNLYSISSHGMNEVANQDQFVDAVDASIDSIRGNSIRMSTTGQLYFRARLAAPPIGTVEDHAILFGNGGPLSLVARAGDIPEGAMNFLHNLGPAQVNESGRVAFGNGGPNSPSSITRFEDGRLIDVLHSGQLLPNGSDEFGHPSLVIDTNSRGSIHFHNAYFEGVGFTGDGLFLIDGETNEVTEIAREGQVVPGVGTIRQTTIRTGPIFTTMTNDDEVAFGVFLDDTPGGEATDFAVLINSKGVISKLAQEGDPAPDGIGKFARLLGGDTDDSGRYFVNAVLAGATGGDEYGANLIYDDGQFQTIVQEGQTVPNGNGVFRSPNLGDVNDKGQWAFLSPLLMTEQRHDGQRGSFLL